MWTVYAYLALLLAASAFAVCCGGQDERIGAASFVLASLASSVPIANYTHVELWFLTVDLAVAVYLVWLLAHSKAYWPIWATGFHLVTVVTHLSVWVQPDILPLAYATFGNAWTYLVLMSLIWGTREHMHYMKRAAQETI